MFLLTWEASPVAIVNAPRRARAALFVCVELGNGGEQRPKAELVFANASAPSLKRRDRPQATRGVIDDWQPLQGYKSDAAKRGFSEQGLGLWSWLAPRASVSERQDVRDSNYAGLFVNRRWRSVASVRANATFSRLPSEPVWIYHRGGAADRKFINPK